MIVKTLVTSAYRKNGKTGRYKATGVYLEGEVVFPLEKRGDEIND